MQSEELRLIDGLFSRLKEAETRSASRDASAEERIAQHVSQQPAAPYYMAQTILIQEAAIKQLNDRIQALEAEVSQLQAAKPSSGGFLSGLFGGGQSRGSDPIPGAEQYGRPQANNAQPQYASQQNYAPQQAVGRSGGGFGVRLDGGNVGVGTVISPYYDSLLVKVTSWDSTFAAACRNVWDNQGMYIKNEIVEIETEA